MFLKCDCRCLFLPCGETAAATNNTVAMSFSMDSRPGDDWVNRLSFWKQLTDRNVMIISRVYRFPGDEPDKRKTFSFYQKVLRAIESAFGRISWVNGTWFLLSLFSWRLTWEIGKNALGLLKPERNESVTQLGFVHLESMVESPPMAKFFHLRQACPGASKLWKHVYRLSSCILQGEKWIVLNLFYGVPVSYSREHCLEIPASGSLKSFQEQQTFCFFETRCHKNLGQMCNPHPL